MPRRLPHPSTHVITLVVALTLALVGLSAFTQALLSPTPPGTTLGTSTLAKGSDSSGGGSSGSSGSSQSDSSDDDDDRSGSSDSSGSNNSGSSSTSQTNSPPPTRSNRVDDAEDEDEDDEEGDDEEDDADEDEDETDAEDTAELLDIESLPDLPFPVPAADRLRIRTQDNRTRIDVTSGGIKVRLERRGDRLVIKAKTESGKDVELDEAELFKIQERLGKSSIKLDSPTETTTLLGRGEVAAVGTFPLSVDLATNALTITTPAGEHQVTILPDQAVRNLLVAGVIDQLVSLQTPVDTSLSFDHLIEFALENNLPVYQIQGLSNQKLLGFIPVQIEKTVAVAAETGEVVGSEQSLTATVLDALSF